MKNETKLNSVQRPNRDSQFDDLNRSTLHRQVTVQSPQPNSPAKKPAVICINVIILHSSASNVLHQYFSDQNPQSVSDFFYLLKVDEVRRYLWIHQFSKIPQKKFDRFLPWKFIQTKYIGILCTHLSRFALRIIKTNHMSCTLSLILTGQKSIKKFSVVFWKLNDFINTFWHHLTFYFCPNMHKTWSLCNIIYLF